MPISVALRRQFRHSDAVDSSRQEIVAAYWTNYQLSHGERADRLASDDSFWAWEIVNDAAMEGAADVLDLLDEVLHADNAEPGYVGAGPIEDLVNTHASRFAPGLAERCRRDPVWREAMLTVVWPEGIPPATFELLREYLRPVPVADTPPPNRRKPAPARRDKSSRGRGKRDR